MILVEPKPTCDKEMEIAIVVETSDKTKDPKELKKIVKEILDKYTLSPEKTRVTVIQYGKTPEVIEPLDKNTPKDKLVENIEERPPMGGEPSLDKALELANKTLFEESPRKYVPKVIYVVKTDEPPTPEEKKKVPEIAKKLKDEHVGIVTVTVGEKAEKPENKEFLKEVASKPKYVVTAKTPDELVEEPKKLNEVVQEACVKRKYLCLRN